MKKLILLTACLMLGLMVFAQGVDFQHLTLDEALAKAKAEKKLVFVDCYTTWCGPCKMMTTKIFPMKEAGDFFNPRFVCVKFDMEQGEGVELKKKWNVRAYPSFFIIRPDGTIQHKIVGGGELEPFIERVEKGLNEKTSLLYLDQQYEKGKMNKKQLLVYKEVLDDAYDQKKAEEVKKELMAQLTEKDKLKKDFWPIFEDRDCVVGSADFDLILDNLSTFEKNIGKERLDEYLFNAYSRALTPYVSGNKKQQQSAVALADLRQQIEKLNISKKDNLLETCALAELVEKGDVEKLLSDLEKSVETLSADDFFNKVMAFSAMEEKVSKADYSRMAALGEKMLANPNMGEMKAFLEYYLDTWKMKAHVGVYFEDLTFEQALAKAAKLRKQIFIDCYTSWCGPCKYMTNTIFPQEEVGDFMNPKFICVKYDMEKGEGPELAEKFGIRAYPTFVILNADGSMRHKFVGGGEADYFMERVEEAADDDKAFGLLDAKYAEGVRDKDFLVKYIKGLESVYSSDMGKVAAELYQQLSDEEKVSKEYWFLFRNEDLSPMGSEPYQYLLANREKFVQNNTKEAVESRLVSGYQRKLNMILYGRDEKTTAADLDQMKKEISALKLGNEKSLLAQLNIVKAYLSKNPNQLLIVCEREANNISLQEFPLMLVANAKKTATPLQLNRWKKLCQKLLTNCPDKEMASKFEVYINSLFE